MAARDATAAAIIAALRGVFPRGTWANVRFTVEDGQVRRDTIAIELRVK
jgi:hypothetical protein